MLNGFAAEGSPTVLVRHDSHDPGSPLHPERSGNAFKADLDDVEPALVVPKRVHSAFHGETDLHAWLQDHAIGQIVVCGIQTNRCCETTARVGEDLGYDVRFAIDATYTFDEPARDGRGPMRADELAYATAVNLHGHFGQVVTTQAALTR